MPTLKTLALRHNSTSAVHLLRRIPPRSPPEHRARHQPAPTRVVAPKQATNQLAGCIQTANRPALRIEDTRLAVNVQSTEGERDATGNGVTYERWCIQWQRPV